MKILLVHNKYKQNVNIGGEDVAFQNELKLLQEKLGVENVLSYEVSNDDINKFKLFYKIWFSLKHYKCINRIVRANKIDLVHIHNFFPLLTSSIFKASKDAGAKVIHTLHNYRLWCISGDFYRDKYGICEVCVNSKFPFNGIINKCYRKSLSQSFIAQIAFWFYRATGYLNNIDYFFVLTKFQNEKIKSLGISQKKIILKPNSMNIQFDRVNNKNGYIYVGRLSESKGLYELLNTWCNLDEKFILTVIGSGDIEGELRIKYNRKNIIFKGKCNRIETLKNISKSMYLIQSSLLYETFGLTIIEAMSCGVPVIGFSIGTRKDLITDNVNGFISTKDKLKDTIEKSYDYKNYELLSHNATLKAKMFQNDYMIKKHINIYEKIVRNKTY